MSDSESDMPEAISFSTAKKNVNAKQKELNKSKAAQAVIASQSKKKVRKVKDEFEGDDFDGDDFEKVSRKKVKSEVQPAARSLSAKVDANLMSMINEELPQKKIKQLEGKFQVTERSKSLKKNDSGPKQLTLSQDVSKASKSLGQGVQVVFSKIAKPVIAVNKSATDFLAARNSMSSAKRQPISRIIARK